MLNKSLFSRSALGALVLAAAAALPAVAQAHDNDYRDYGRQDRYYDRYDQRWAQRPYWEREHAYWYWRNMHDRRFDGPRGYYTPAYSYAVPQRAPVVVYHHGW